MGRAARRRRRPAPGGGRGAGGGRRASASTSCRPARPAAAVDILTMGITFTVYSDGRGIDRAWPFDVIPRVIDGGGVGARRAPAWCSGCGALNRFIDDLYNDQRDRRRRRVPGRAARRLGRTSGPSAAACTRSSACGPTSAGTDLVRDADGTMYVLEDNLRVPSGVSYVLENRAVAKRAFPDLFARQSILPVDAYTDELQQAARVARARRRRATRRSSCSRRASSTRPTSSTRSSPSGWAPTLVEGGDLVVGDDDCVYMRTIDGPRARST